MTEVDPHFSHAEYATSLATELARRGWVEGCIGVGMENYCYSARAHDVLGEMMVKT